MPIELWPISSVFLARVEDDVVILDIKDDRYQCLPDVGDGLGLQPDGRLVVQDMLIADELQAAGICTPLKPEQFDRRFHIPNRDLVTTDEVPMPRLLVTASSLLAATLAFRGRTLSELTRPLLSKNPRSSDGNTELALWVSAYRAAMPWVPFEGECLQRAFLLRWLLARQGIAVSWVFGVRTWPFAAHCWLQVDDLVVGDTVERVSRYVPIMAV